MVSYDDIYEIRLAQKEEIPAIMSFIKDCWSENHIMARDRALFEYEFAYVNGYRACKADGDQNRPN